jgi:riboflavin kinase / FMN adenylyltransferase
MDVLKPAQDADVSTAALPTIRGRVVHGDARGRGLGFPTANIEVGDTHPDLEFGVYAARVLGRPAAVSVGVRPTFGEGLRPLLEAHILDFSADLYGRDIEVELLRFLRPERRFHDLDELVEQVAADIRAVRDVLATVAG